MKICHFMLSCFYKEGGGYQENLLPKFHAKMGLEVRIASNSNDWNESPSEKEFSYVNDNGIPVTIFKTKPVIFKRFHLLQTLYSLTNNQIVGISEYLQREKPNIIFIHGGTHIGNLEIAKYASKNNVKLYVDQHADYYNTPVTTVKQRLIVSFFYKHIIQKLYKLCETYWGVTPWRVQYLRDVYSLPEAKTKLLVMGGDDEKIDFEHRDAIRTKVREQHRIPDGDFLIVTGGKIDEAKNIHLLIEALSECENVKLLVFGKPVDAFRETYETVCQNASSVINIGWLSAEKVYDYFLAADLVVFPGTHSVLWEQAAACAVPLVVKHWEGMRHVNVNGNCAFISFSPTPSASNIQESIIPILTDKGKWREMKRAANECHHTFLYSDIAQKSIGMHKDIGITSKNRLCK